VTSLEGFASDISEPKLLI